MRAIWQGEVIAEAPKDQLIYIEQNWYFPQGAVRRDLLMDSGTTTICPWKGEAHYYSIKVDNEINGDAAWYYPEPKESAISSVKQDFSNYVAFWRGVEVKD
ncbi:nucleotidyltransferase domain-containing protein [Candidatus Saccharibacteria bacterium]|nr:MAG: nucleotidyltransferase domain-containing protein [Candidatus Saccharibacteria bacterium]